MPGRIIKKLREERKITQNEMATLLFMSQANYSKIENNKVGLTAELSKRIVRILNVSFEDILPDDAILESSLLVKEKKELEDTMERMDKLLTNKLDELKMWMEMRFSNNTNTNVN